MTAGVYLHIPFCKSRCSYCDFATDVYRTSDAVDRYVTALCSEVDRFHEVDPKSHIPNPKSVDTIYFGGGTPSLLTPDQLESIIHAVYQTFDVAADTEITMEMNPATVTPETLKRYKSLGVDRASFGVQTFDDRALKLLARGHDANDARTTFAMLRDAGFGNISFDLIAGLPGQTLDAWKENLDEAVTMEPDHLSLYLLEIHQGTPLAEQVRSGRQPSPDDDLAAEMYELMIDKLAVAGYEQYEISNFAKPGFRSRHNTKYWRLDPVYGFGVSAHSFDGRQRYSNERDTAKYVEQIEKTCSAEIFRETIDPVSEFVFLGLRLNDGIRLGEFCQRFDADLKVRFERELAELIEKRLVELSGDRLKLTPKGRLFSNDVFSEFV